MTKKLAARNVAAKFAFTMAEILLSLTIIGVVAAITLPSLIGNINERAWNTQRKALHARMAQAIAMMPYLNGYGTFTTSEDGTVIQDTAAMTFVTEGLAKVLKINNVCDSTKLADCGIATSYTDMAGTQKTMASNMFGWNSTFKDFGSAKYDTKAAAFETVNGESIVVYYNPYCQSNKWDGNTTQSYSEYAQQYMCANFVYDLNGAKGPNQVGKDMGFITAIYADDSDVVSPYFPIQASNDGTAKFADGAAAKICRDKGEEYRLPNLSEGMAMSYNKDFLGLSYVGYWTGNAVGLNHAWYLGLYDGQRGIEPINSTVHVRCVKR